MNILYTDDTICAIATAQGGAIGTIRVSGKEAITITDKIFTPVNGVPLSERKPYTLTFGHIDGENSEIVDEVLVSLFRGPHSYTGEDSTEISCHGSSYILQQVMQLLIKNGCRRRTGRIHTEGIPERQDGPKPGRSRGRPYSINIGSIAPHGNEPDARRIQP